MKFARGCLFCLPAALLMWLVIWLAGGSKFTVILIAVLALGMAGAAAWSTRRKAR